MSFERVKAVMRTLRFRLMLWNAGAVILTGLAILVSVREGVRYTLIYEMDQVLGEDLQEITLSFPGDSDYHWYDLLDQLSRKAIGHNYHGWFVQFYDERGNVAWSSINAPSKLELPGSTGASGKDTQHGYRIVYRPMPRNVEQAALVCVGCSTSFVARDMSRLDRLVMFCAGTVLLISPLGGYLLAVRATRPLVNVIQTTARLRPQELHERLRVRGTGDELDQLALAFNALLDRIAHYLEQRRDFLANAAHELRTPLAAIRSSVEVALDGSRTVDEYNELLAEVIDECMSLEGLVNQLLLLAETESDRLKSGGEPVPLDILARKAIEMFQGVAEERHVQLQAGPLPSLMIEGNRHHLRQVLDNLLDNAIKFTAAKYQAELDARPSAGVDGNEFQGKVTVSLCPDASGTRALLQIEDNGPGISAEHLPHIFERFYRATRWRGRDSLAAGAGLGLSICQAIVEAQGGTIAVTSEFGHSTIMTVSLPLAAAETGEPAIVRESASV